jgi:anaerobic ribonucleoside-triphosphate reductase activating protein
MTLRISHLLYPVYNLGPGKRIALWFQGCSIRCPGCLNPENWDFSGGHYYNVMEIYMMIKTIEDNYTGLSISGGEPFDQYDALILLCAMLKENTKLDILIFSGYNLGQLYTDHPDQHFLDVMDYLIDGPYIKENPAESGLRGSINQNMYHIVDRIVMPTEELQSTNICSLHLDNDNSAYCSGIPRNKDMERLIETLHKEGLNWS